MDPSTDTDQSFQSILSFLQTLPRFKNYNDTEINDLAQCMEIKGAINAGKLICRRGDLADCAFIVMIGELVANLQMPTGSKQEVARYLPGTMVGEICLIEEGRRSMEIEAATSAEILVIRKERFDALRAADNSAAYKLIHSITLTLCDRLRANNLRVKSKIFGEESHTLGAVTASVDLDEDKGLAFKLLQGLFGKGADND
ncbi:MAG: cyclic nucleotide-binding domain-containing protein [Myxococcota bacterium]|nr:cyclic nucleotide-binding domain-containing protein [Myxococcota bacterium]